MGIVKAERERQFRLALAMLDSVPSADNEKWVQEARTDLEQVTVIFNQHHTTHVVNQSDKGW